MSWLPGHSRAIAQTLHVAALAGTLGPGYARRDATLRRAAGLEPAALDGDFSGTGAALQATVSTGTSPWEQHDTAWFDKRWTLGEAEAVRDQSQALADQLNTLAVGGLLPEEAAIQASMAVGGSLLVTWEPALVVAAPSASVRAITVVLVGERLRHALPPDTLEPRDRRWMAEAIACAAIRRVVGEEVFAGWLGEVSGHLASAHDRATRVEDQVRRIARKRLDQPPGEIQRIALGLGRRQVSRLDRASRRGFFVPPDFDFEVWLDETLKAGKRSSAR